MNISPLRITAFQEKIYSYFSHSGRDLPWRKTTDPYHVFVSEVMLQQTQVDRVIPKYFEFTRLFPDFSSLAQASKQEVLSVWSGLGYNRRALFLHESGQIVASEYKGKLPAEIEAIDALPGIGLATASSICAFAFNMPTVFIETNIRAVYIHEFSPNKSLVEDEDILPLVEQTLDKNNPRKWYNALMDYGTCLKSTQKNPSRKSRHYTKQSAFVGSKRQVRGAILKLLLKQTPLKDEIYALLPDFSDDMIDEVMIDLITEKIIKNTDGILAIAD